MASNVRHLTCPASTCEQVMIYFQFFISKNIYKFKLNGVVLFQPIISVLQTMAPTGYWRLNPAISENCVMENNKREKKVENNETKQHFSI